MNRNTMQITMGLLMRGAMLLSGCQTGLAQPQGALGVAELLEAPVYESQIRVYGQVSQLGELRCPCFALTDDGAILYIWYDAMVDDDESQWPPVDISGVANGDWVVGTGELRESDGFSGTFWASGIEVVR